MNNQNKNESIFVLVERFPEPQRTETITAVTELMSLKMLPALMEMLSEADITEMNGIVDSGATPDDIYRWLRGRVPNFEQLRMRVAEEAEFEIRQRLTIETNVITPDPTDTEGPTSQDATGVMPMAQAA